MTSNPRWFGTYCTPTEIVKEGVTVALRFANGAYAAPDEHGVF
jgi:hypothetical protein